MQSLKQKRDEDYNKIINNLNEKKVLKEIRKVIQQRYPSQDIGKVIRQEIKDLIEQQPGFVKIIIKEAFIEYLEKYQIREIVDMYLIKELKWK